MSKSLKGMTKENRDKAIARRINEDKKGLGWLAAQDALKKRRAAALKERQEQK